MELIQEEMPISKPFLKVYCSQTDRQGSEILEFFEDRILNKTENGNYCLFLDFGIGFEINF